MISSWEGAKRAPGVRDSRNWQVGDLPHIRNFTVMGSEGILWAIQ